VGKFPLSIFLCLFNIPIIVELKIKNEANPGKPPIPKSTQIEGFNE